METIPKLELCGALLMAQLVNHLQTINTRVKIDNCFYWCDSTIVLAWLEADPAELQTFVANRVAQIQELTEVSEWRHISSHDNPADCLSRGMIPSQLIDNDLWWYGPNWLLESEQFWPTRIRENAPLLETKAKTSLVNLQHKTVPLLEFSRFSNYSKLVRIIAYVHRFIHNCKRNAVRLVSSDAFSVVELHDAELSLLRSLQDECFSAEIKSIQSNSLKRGRLLNLNPFIDENKIVRVGGRLSNHPTLPKDRVYPRVLPKHYVVELMIREQHNKG